MGPDMVQSRVGPVDNVKIWARMVLSQLTEEEIDAAQMQAEEKPRRGWENAIPLSGQLVRKYDKKGQSCTLCRTACAFRTGQNHSF